MSNEARAVNGGPGRRPAWARIPIDPSAIDPSAIDPSAAATLALAFVLSACASSAVTRVDETTAVKVTYLQSGREFSLWSQAVASPSEVYSDGSLAQVKVANDEQMGELLRAFEAARLFEQPSLASAADLGEAIVLERDGKTWVWTLNAADPGPFAKARTAVLATFNDVQSLHTAPGFRIDGNRIRQDNTDRLRDAQRATDDQGSGAPR